MLYVYAVTESASAPLDDQRGLEDEALQSHVRGPVAAVFTRHAPAARLSPTAENVWRHEQVVERLMRDRPVLPCRFGTCFGDDARLGAALESHQRPLAEGLRRVEGCVELGLRVLWEPPPPPPSPPPPNPPADTGRAYMAARVAEERRRRDAQQHAESAAAALHAPLSALAVDSTKRVLPAPQVVLAGAYLVPREQTGAFKEHVEELAKARPDLRLLCTGPWPPYHFVPTIADVT